MGTRAEQKPTFLWQNSLQPESWFNLLPINASFSSQPRVSRKRQTGVIKHLVVSPRSRWASLAAQGRGNSRGAMCASRRCQGATHHPELTDKGQIMRHANSCVCTLYSFLGEKLWKMECGWRDRAEASSVLRLVETGYEGKALPHGTWPHCVPDCALPEHIGASDGCSCFFFLPKQC